MFDRSKLRIEPYLVDISSNGHLNRGSTLNLFLVHNAGLIFEICLCCKCAESTLLIPREFLSDKNSSNNKRRGLKRPVFICFWLSIIPNILVLLLARFTISKIFCGMSAECKFYEFDSFVMQRHLECLTVTTFGSLFALTIVLLSEEQQVLMFGRGKVDMYKELKS
ncbi:hypothetical protein H5410_027744 [Solanum commersonii]|uniref:Uncharacterized protein n=1 Tax=Solanum commersonii TaxID=4109 RepID=A0A9J5Z483_SOLCO|nr:hypothetical protein H5410_027744 [Solanum commersonii]